MVPNPNERKKIVLEMHKEIRHFGEQRTFIEICKQFYQRNRTKQIKAMVKACKNRQLTKQIGSIKSDVEDLKSIMFHDLFYRITFDIVGPLRKTINGNKYIFLAIDHYSKWCEAKVIFDHTTTITTKFLEEEIICRYKVLKFILIDNGGE